MANNKNNRNGYEASIPGLSDVDIMPRRGFIRLGESMEERAEKGLNYPKELGHLGRIDASGEDVKLFRSLYGSEPAAIKIVFASNQPTENFPQEFVSWNSRGQKKCYGNGRMGFEREISLNEQARQRLDAAKDAKEREFLESRLSPEDYDYKETAVPCAGFECPRYKGNKCQLEGTLKFLIAGMEGLRLFWIRTGSKWTMKTVRTMHETIRSLTSPNGDPDFGRIRGIPLLLTREKKQYTLPTGVKTTKWVLSLDVAGVGISDLLSLADPTAIAERAKQAKVLLEAPEDVPDQEAKRGAVASVEEKAQSEVGLEREEEADMKTGELSEEPLFDPENSKQDFLSLQKATQIEILERLIERKAYDKTQLKKPLEKFSEKHRQMFWDELSRAEDAVTAPFDDIPF